MSPASYRTAPPRVGDRYFTGSSQGGQIGVCWWVRSAGSAARGGLGGGGRVRGLGGAGLGVAVLEEAQGPVDVLTGFLERRGPAGGVAGGLEAVGLGVRLGGQVEEAL